MKLHNLLLVALVGIALAQEAEVPQQTDDDPEKNAVDEQHWKPKPTKPPAKPSTQAPTTAAPVQNSTSASSGTTYDWGQHTGSTYDWGQHTKTQAPNQNSTGAPGTGTTYDWGQHTGSTYDWGQHTKTQAPNQNTTGTPSTGTTYDWGQHTGSTYDWGQHTSTQAPGNGTDDNNGDNNHGQGDDQNKCGPGTYACAGAIGLCIARKQVCNGQIDCPHADDEEPRVCHPNFVPGGGNQRPHTRTNKFRGQGFMFHIKHVRVNGGSHVKMFNQDSDNNRQLSGRSKSTEEKSE